MPGTHISKSTAPGGESSEKPIIIGYPVPGSELPSTEELGTSEEKARLELLGWVDQLLVGSLMYLELAIEQLIELEELF